MIQPDQAARNDSSAFKQTDTTSGLLPDTLYARFSKHIMSEVTFAKSYLATLDKRPIKIAADYASDPRKYPNQSPVSTLINQL
jgi:hypothetical protein